MEPNPKKEVKSNFVQSGPIKQDLGKTTISGEVDGELKGATVDAVVLDEAVKTKTKQCLQCEVDKPLSDFYKGRIQCKQCMKDDYSRYQRLHTLQPEIRRQKLIDLLQEAVNRGKQIADNPVGYNTEEWTERIIGFFSKSREEY